MLSCAHHLDRRGDREIKEEKIVDPVLACGHEHAGLNPLTLDVEDTRTALDAWEELFNRRTTREGVMRHDHVVAIRAEIKLDSVLWRYCVELGN